MEIKRDKYLEDLKDRIHLEKANGRHLLPAIFSYRNIGIFPAGTRLNGMETHPVLWYMLL